MRWLLCPLLAALAACTHAPQRSKDAQNWIELSSEHFVLWTDVPEQDARSNLFAIEQVRAALLTVGWHLTPAAKGRVVVVQLQDRSEMEEFANKGVDGFAAKDAFGEPLLVIHADADILNQNSAPSTRAATRP